MNSTRIAIWATVSTIACLLALFAAGIQAEKARRAAQGVCAALFVAAQLALLTACGGGGSEEEEEPATVCTTAPTPQPGHAAIPAKPCGKPTI